MKFALKVLAVLLTIVVVSLIVAIVTVPNKRTIHQETEINASREIVWQVLNDKAKYTEWQDSISEVRVKDDNNWVEIAADGGQEIVFRRTLADEPSAMRLEYTMGDDFKGKWQGELKRLSPTKTIIKTTDSSEIQSGMMKIMMALFFDYEEFVKDWNKKLKKQAEALQSKQTIESPLHPN